MIKFKNICIVSCTIAMAFAMTACGNNTADQPSTTDSDVAKTTVSETTDVTDSNTTDPATTESTVTETKPEVTEPVTTEPEVDPIVEYINMINNTTDVQASCETNIDIGSVYISHVDTVVVD